MIERSQKDFGPIADDYSFFEQHATEAAADARAYAARLRELSAGDGTIRMLDFGCGSGTFTERLLRLADWPAGRLRLTLVEPVESVRREARARLAPFSAAPLVDSATLPADAAGGFEFVLANHVLYYVDDVRRSVAALVEAVAPGDSAQEVELWEASPTPISHPFEDGRDRPTDIGVRDPSHSLSGQRRAGGMLATAIAGRTNALIEIWIAAFRMIGREVPYHTSEDVEAALVELGVEYEKESVPYELTFVDSEENRMRIIRFLLAEHLHEMPVKELLAMFDRYSRGGEVRVRTASDHYTVRGR